MRRRIVRIILALTLLVTLAGQVVNVPLFGHTPGALATGGLTLNPSSGPVGTVVQLLAPAGTFTNSGPITVTFVDANGHTAVTTTRVADATGGLLTADNVTVTIPAQAAGPISTITVSDNTSSTSHPAVNAVFIIVPQITPTPNNTVPGGSVSVSGTGFAPNSAVNIYIGTSGSSVGSATSDAYGNINVNITVPASYTPGTTFVFARDGNNDQTQNTPFTINNPGGSTPPTSTYTSTATATATNTPIGGGIIVLNPASGPPGTTTVRVTAGYNTFTPNSQLVLFFTDANGNSAANVSLGTATSANDGSLNTTVTIPNSATGGNATISVNGGGRAVSATFTVTPLLVITPNVVAPGSTVQLNGSGFVPNRVITFALNLQTVQTIAPVATTSTGTFTTNITLPANLPIGGAYITATDQTNSNIQALVQFTVALTTPTASPTLSYTPLPTYTPTVTGTPPTLTPYPTLVPTSTTTPAATVTTAYFAEGYTGLAATNGKATFSEVLNLLNPSAALAPVTITYYVQGVAGPQVVNKTIPANSVLRESVNADVGPDRVVGAVVTSPSRVISSRTITRVSPASTRLDGSTTLPTGAPATSWSFPEGYTGISFQEYLTVLNPGNVTATVQILLAPQADSAAAARTYTITVPAQSRGTANIRGINAGNSAKSVGMIVTSNVPVVAERVEYFGDGAGSGKFGETASRGFTTPASELRIGYATSGGTAIDTLGRVGPAGDQGYVTLLNPALSGAPVRVTVGFSNSAGQSVGQPASVNVAPGTRQTVSVNVALGPTVIGPVSVAISASGPVVAELAQYYGGTPNAGQHPGVAIPAASGATTDAFLSDLSTQLVDGAPVARKLFIYNPYSAAIQIAATYYGSTGATAPVSYTVPAGGVTTVNVNQDTQSSIAAGPLGVELRVTSAGSFLAVGIGQSVDTLSATEDIGAAS